jgi:D-alanyl-D-alanine dipeptidase
MLYKKRAFMQQITDHFCDVITLSTHYCKVPILGKLAYATDENFLGRIVKGYHPSAIDVCLLTHKAARALCAVQNELLKQDLSFFIYDAYRPLQAVQDFTVWFTMPIVHDKELTRKSMHYPYHRKEDLSKLGYAASNVSRHCFGNTVDGVLFCLKKKELVNMGTIFDYFDEASHLTAPSHLIGEEAYFYRQLLKETMVKYGFISLSTEYWDFEYQEREIHEPANFEIILDLKGLNARG